MKKLHQYKYIIIWMLLIFCFSHQPREQSSKISYDLTTVVVQTVEKMTDTNINSMNHIHHLIRKNAHFFLYFVLGILTLQSLPSILRLRSMAIAFSICIFYALSDEFHQLFVSGRGAQLSDVVIDSIGAFLGVTCYAYIVWLFTKRKVTLTSNEMIEQK